MQNSKEQQGEIRKPEVINAKKQRKILEWEIRDTKGTFHTKMGTVKDRNSKDLTEEEIKKWQKYTEELYKNDS